MSTEQAWPVIEEWNQRCNPPWSEHDLRRKLNEANKQGGERGWLLSGRSYTGPDIDLSSVLSNLDSTCDDRSEPAVPRFSTEASTDWTTPPPGFCKDFVDHCLATAKRRQPELALLTSLATLATLAGRKVRDEYDTRCNVYFIGLAGSGSGKEHPRQIAKQLFVAIGRERAFCEAFASAQGITARLNEETDQLAVIDEFGRYLATQTGKRAESWLAQIPTVLMRLYSSSNSVFIQDLKAVTRPNDQPIPVIHSPNLSLAATTVPETFFAALSSASTIDGFLNRMMVVQATDDLPLLQKVAFRELPRSLVTAARVWSDFTPGEGNLASQNPIPTIVPTSSAASARLDEYQQHCDDVARNSDTITRGLFVRCSEKANKLALLYACSESHSPEISLAGAEWAIQFVDQTTRFIIDAVADRVADNPFQAEVKEVRRVIHDAGAEGLLASRVTAAMRHKMKARDLNQIIAQLVEADDVRQSQVPTKGRPGILLVDSRHS